MSVRTKQYKIYTELAPIYDYVMRHVNYRKWAEYVSTLFQFVGMDVKTILDVACGTGTLGLILNDMGFHVLGFDYSPDMVLQGIQKARREGNSFHLWCGDMTQFAKQKPVDAVLCLYDSMNYLMEENQWQRTFPCVARVLQPGGLFIFDISTEANSFRHFHDNTEKDHGPGFKYIRQSTYDKTTKVQVNEFQITWKNRPNQVIVETHQQIVLSLESVENRIPKSEFTVLGIYDDFSTEPGTELSDRVHFLLQKHSATS
jgi:predicted TPR repeat methyltransferase